MTVWLYVIIPKGFFPVQDTGVIIGISEAPQSVSFGSMATRQIALAKVILKDPAVDSLSSFIGVDGTNATVNSGRIQINLKPIEQRGLDASAVIRRLQPALAAVEGITLFMQPVQDITVEDRVSRTEFQYSLEDADATELSTWVNTFMGRLERVPILRIWQDQQNLGLQTRLVIDRGTASRLGITPQMIDDTLYDAFGQRQVSTIFTQLNQYHVVLETAPALGQNPGTARGLLLHPHGQGGTVPLRDISHVETSRRRSHQTIRDSSPWSRCPSTSRRMRLSATRSGDLTPSRATCTCREHSADYQGTAQRVPGLARQTSRC